MTASGTTDNLEDKPPVVSEHAHIWQWDGYHFTMSQGQGFLHWRCQFCGKRREEQVVMTDWWYGQARRIWEFEQRNHGIFDDPESEEAR